MVDQRTNVPASPARRRQIVGFVACSLAAVALAMPVVGLVFGMAGIGPGSPAAMWLPPVVVSGALLSVSWAFLKHEKAGLDSLGLAFTGRRFAEFTGGLAAASAVFAVVALARAAWVDADWTFDPAAGMRAALVGLPFAFVLMFGEELLFRGYAFQKALALWGTPVALVGSSLFFGAYHVVGSGYWGMGAFFLFLTPAAGGLLFGLAAVRTGGLALPLGLHLGGNWISASVMGLGVAEGHALWAAPVDTVQTAWLMAPDILPRLPYLLGVAALITTVTCLPIRARETSA